MSNNEQNTLLQKYLISDLILFYNEVVYFACNEHLRLANLLKNKCKNAVQLAKNGFYFNTRMDRIQCFACHIDHNHHHREDCYFDKPSTLAPPHRKKIFNLFQSLYYEKERLHTFIEWPIPWVSPQALASHGFFYLRYGDACMCVFCKKVIRHWSICSDQDLAIEQRHKLESPECEFVSNNLSNKANITLKESRILDKLRLTGEESPLLSSSMIDDWIHKDFSLDTVEGRQKTFKLIKIQLQIPQRSYQLAQAGFYYCGYGDSVRCFMCNNGFRNWEIDDNPWELHSYWYPDCPYVKIINSSGFVCPQPLRHQKKRCSGKFHSINEQDLDTLISTSSFQREFFDKYNPISIKNTLKHQLDKCGVPFINLVDWKKALKKNNKSSCNILLPNQLVEYSNKPLRLPYVPTGIIPNSLFYIIYNYDFSNLILLPCRHLAIIHPQKSTHCSICNMPINYVTKFR